MECENDETCEHDDERKHRQVKMDPFRFPTEIHLPRNKCPRGLPIKGMRHRGRGLETEGAGMGVVKTEYEKREMVAMQLPQ